MFLARIAGTNDQETRLPETLDTLTDIGQLQAIVLTPQVLPPRECRPIYLLAALRKLLGGYVRTAEFSKHTCDLNHVVQSRAGHSGRRYALRRQAAARNKKRAATAQELVNH